MCDSGDPMTAVRVLRYGSPPSKVCKIIDTVSTPQVSDGIFRKLTKMKLTSDDVLVQVRCASVVPLDSMAIEGKFKMMAPRLGKWTPGYEVSGIVEQVGADVAEFEIGDRVYGTVWGHNTGTLAEYALIDRRGLALIPKNLSFEEAAPLGYSLLTIEQIFNGCPEDERSYPNVLLVGGAGGVGTLAIQAAKAWYGAKNVVVTAHGEEKTEALLKLGADEVVDYKEHKDNLVKWISERQTKFDLVVSMVDPKEQDLKPLVDACAEGGRLVSLFQPSAERIKNYVGLPLVSKLFFRLAPTFANKKIKTYEHILAMKKHGKGTYDGVVAVASGDVLRKFEDSLDSSNVRALVLDRARFEGIAQGEKILDLVAKGHMLGKAVLVVSEDKKAEEKAVVEA